MRGYSSPFRPWRSSVALSCTGARSCRCAPCRRERCRRAARRSTDSNITRPSALPSDISHARSGCGIKPTTFRASLQMPAIESIEPFGFASSVTRAGGIDVAEHDLPILFELPQLLRRREVVAFAVGDGNAKHLLRPARERERRVGLLDADVHVLAAELQVRDCAASRPAAGRPRAESGSRCRCRAPARRRPQTSSTASITGENRAMAPVRR